MSARVAEIVRGDASPEHGVAFFRDRVLPDLRQYEGFREAMVLVPREGEEVLVISSLGHRGDNHRGDRDDGDGGRGDDHGRDHSGLPISSRGDSVCASSAARSAA
jgi:hypothetical protein